VVRAHADLLEAALRRGQPVRLKLALDCGIEGSYTGANVIGEITGSARPDEVVVLGGHLDSWDAGTGAIDDGAGVAIAMAAGHLIGEGTPRPQRSVRVIAFANEEMGLFGGRAYAEAHRDEVARHVLGAESDFGAGRIWRLEASVKPEARGAIDQIMQVLAPLGVERGAGPGEGGPDLAWNAKGYATTMPFESSMSGDNKAIHTANDTLANSDSTGAHSLKFARMGLAYAVELGSDGPTTTPGDKTETFTGSLSTGQTKSFGPFKVGAGGTFKLSTTGTGDIDIYGRLGAVPTTSTYGCKSDGSTATETCTINVTANSDGYVLVKGYTAGSYTLTVTYRPQ